MNLEELAACCGQGAVRGSGVDRFALEAPPPGEPRLRRRIGEYDDFVTDLIATVERQPVDGGVIGSRWDLEGDPAALRLVELWAYVAESVAAYTELTAGEAYLPTAQDWSDLRRIAALVGFKPRPPIAAQGWVVAELDKGVDPVVPAGTRVQAPAVPGRASQTYEVIADTQLRAEWNGLVATWPPQVKAPVDRTLRFLGDPGFQVADRILLVEELPGPGEADNWFDAWQLLLGPNPGTAAAQPPEPNPGTAAAEPLALATVCRRSTELGTTLIGLDRDLELLLPSQTKPYAAYGVRAIASPARQLEKVLRVPAAGTTADELTLTSQSTAVAIDQCSIVLDRPIEDLSQGRLVAVVDWAGGACDVVPVKLHSFCEWAVAPGTKMRVSAISFETKVPTLAGTGPFTVYVLDRRVAVRHFVLPDEQPSSPARVRLYPRPTRVPERIAVQIANDWQVFECAGSAEQENPSAGRPSGLIVDVIGVPPARLSGHVPASGNLLRVRHGKTAQAVLGSGEAGQPNQRFTTPDAPIAYDLDETGSPAPSLTLRVEGVRWDEVPTLYGQGKSQVHSVLRARDGSETIQFGDGIEGARLPTGRGNVTASYRTGGGRAGDVPSGAIDSLLGSVRGVKKVRGAGQTEGAADQDDEGKLRDLAPTRARALGRGVSAEDLVDLALGYPGVTHAAVWRGAGPPGCGCGRAGLHLAFVRNGTAGPRAPLEAEIGQLASYLTDLRDSTVPLCVAAGVVSRPKLIVVLALDPRRVPGDVIAAVEAALVDADGDLGPARRELGQPLDRSDVFAVIHRVPGVVGVTSLDLPGACQAVGRLAAPRWELLVPSSDPEVGGGPA